MVEQGGIIFQSWKILLPDRMLVLGKKKIQGYTRIPVSLSCKFLQNYLSTKKKKKKNLGTNNKCCIVRAYFRLTVSIVFYLHYFVLLQQIKLLYYEQKQRVLKFGLTQLQSPFQEPHLWAVVFPTGIGVWSLNLTLSFYVLDGNRDEYLLYAVFQDPTGLYLFPLDRKRIVAIIKKFRALH